MIVVAIQPLRQLVRGQAVCKVHVVIVYFLIIMLAHGSHTLFIKFDTVLKDSLSYIHSSFGVCL